MKTIKPDPKAPLVLSLGDPSGIGPEIIAKAWQTLRHQPDLAFCVIGDARLLAAHGVEITRISAIADSAENFASALPVLDRPLSTPAVAGTPDSRNAPHIIDAIREAVDLCLTGQARAVITAPIAKSVLYASGFAFPGHTEYLAELCKVDGVTPQPVMMLTAPDASNLSDLRVVLATIHLPLAEVPTHLSRAHLMALARITHDALIRDFAIATPRLVMAGLNPHAGEDGTIGREEIDLLRPAITDLQNEMNISGPYPADSLFHEEARRRYDAVLCMYHDQGLIPLKALDFWSGVNITLGLPIVRTSPDHGTGFDIAGKGIARADSLIAAIRTADTISRNRARA